MKVHLNVEGASLCGRGSSLHKSPRAVTCNLCRNSERFAKVKEADDKRRHEAFMSQVPRQIREPWLTMPVNITCRECQGNLFREGDRTCYGHYANFHCANCGHVESRLTETGMSF